MTSGLLSRLEGQVLAAVETLRRAEAMSAAEGRADLRLPLAAVDGHLQAALTEVAAARRAGRNGGSEGPEGAAP